MSDNTSDTNLGDAVREYQRLRYEAQAFEERFDEEATLRALAAKTGIPMDIIRMALSPTRN